MISRQKYEYILFMGCNKHVTGQHKWQLQISTIAAAYCRSVKSVIGLKHRFKNKTQLHLPTQNAASYKRCIIQLDNKNLCKNE